MNGTLSRQRKQPLKDPKYSLADMLIDGRKIATSSAQASGIGEYFKTNTVGEIKMDQLQFIKKTTFIKKTIQR